VFEIGPQLVGYPRAAICDRFPFHDGEKAIPNLNEMRRSALEGRLIHHRQKVIFKFDQRRLPIKVTRTLTTRPGH
jgi:hypothetical protein